jgi:hypothetical protein
MTCTRADQCGAVLAGVKAKPLRGGLRPALTPAPGATRSAAIGSRPETWFKIKNLRGASTL